MPLSLLCTTARLIAHSPQTPSPLLWNMSGSLLGVTAARFLVIPAPLSPPLSPKKKAKHTSPQSSPKPHPLNKEHPLLFTLRCNPPGSLAVTFPKARQTHELTPTPPQPMTTQPPVNTTHQNSNIQPTANHAIIPHTDIQAPHDIPPIPPKPALSQSQKVAQLSATENHIIAQDSGTVLPDPKTSYLSGFNPITCIESKMDSLRSLSASSSAAKEDYAETSTASISSPEHHDISPPLVRKKKGGKKRKEARGL